MTPGSPANLDDLVSQAQRAQAAGRLVEAAAVFRKILNVRPDVAEVHNDLGIVLAQQGKLDLAAARFARAIALKPGLLEAHFNLGNSLKELGKLDEAAAAFRQALALKPDYAEAHNNLGNVLLDQGKLDEAAAHYRQALALWPNLADAHNNLGHILWKQGKPDEAAERIEHALALQPNLAEAHNNLGNILAQQDKLEEAIARLERALVLKPDYAEARNNLGSILWKQEKLEAAAAQFERVLALVPNNPQAHNNLGNVLMSQGQLDQAAARFEHALSLRPNYFEAHNNLGAVLMSQGQLDQAAARFEQALALRPDFADAQVALATCHLVNGDYARGWPAYEARLRMPSHPRLPELPRWTGEALAGCSLLLVAEQGLGDTIHFLRYARLLKQQGARVVLAAQSALQRFLTSHPDVDEFVKLDSPEDWPATDFYLPLHSAPWAFRTDAATIPSEIPYVWADPELTEQWRQELAAIDGFKIGIVWQGSRAYLSDRWRSIPLTQFAPLAKVAGVQLISLQKGFGSEQIAAVDFPVLDLSARLDEATGPFLDTAAVLQNLDLVVTANSAIAHLAGALGVPVWVALPFSPDWRWLHGREDTPWYPTMRLFRQTTLGEWPEVFERITAAVGARMETSLES
jgi:Tfp pilus assembly protein PilF